MTPRKPHPFSPENTVAIAFGFRKLKKVYDIAKRFKYQGTKTLRIIAKGSDVVDFLAAMLEVESSFDEKGNIIPPI
jgi:predicted RND superfamily exporter protein